MSGLAVVKLGGSFAGSWRLAPWLDVLAGSGGRIVVTPGGGPFADAVREAQAEMKFGDTAAHAMALLAMEQFAHALADLHRGLRLAHDEAEMLRILAEGGVPVWRPTAMALGAADIPASWEVTSDSLAVWLAGRLRADTVVLIKNVAPMPDLTADAMAERGIVDRAFPSMLGRVRVSAWIAGPDAYGDVGDLLAGRAPGAGVERVSVRTRRYA